MLYSIILFEVLKCYIIIISLINRILIEELLINFCCPRHSLSVSTCGLIFISCIVSSLVNGRVFKLTLKSWHWCPFMVNSTIFQRSFDFWVIIPLSFICICPAPDLKSATYLRNTSSLNEKCHYKCSVDIWSNQCYSVIIYSGSLEVGVEAKNMYIYVCICL